MTTRRVNVRGIIYKNGLLLVTKFRQTDDSESEYWGTFGGGLDVGESVTDGLHREMIEETGIAPIIGRLLFIQQFHDGEKEQFELFFHITNTADYEKIDLQATSHGLLELTQLAFVDPKESYVLPSFLGEIDLADHIDNDRPVFFHNELT